MAMRSTPREKSTQLLYLDRIYIYMADITMRTSFPSTWNHNVAIYYREWYMEGVFFVSSILFVIKAFLLTIHSIRVERGRWHWYAFWNRDFYFFLENHSRDNPLCNYDILTDFAAWVVWRKALSFEELLPFYDKRNAVKFFFNFCGEKWKGIKMVWYFQTSEISLSI